MSNQQCLGVQLVQLNRDASAAGAACRVTTQRKNVEIGSVGAVGKSDPSRVKKYFIQEFLDKEQEDTDEDLDFRALENGFVFSKACDKVMVSYKRTNISWMSSI
ncbi:uncharacterized protein LOC126659525 [Mercurialis annua]|uniref:uncharacterized protein LOC126659525 n=1 Tax=Mercurialis annua TaxID=3986 RepID=UPI00215F554E|nr:uncharacterized protein LOC126659525 [Mercurialis annua]